VVADGADAAGPLPVCDDRVVVLCADEKSSPASSDCSNESRAHQASDMLIFVPALSKEGVKRASGGEP